eukprot:5602422-Prymnesium_polylepis.2
MRDPPWCAEAQYDRYTRGRASSPRTGFNSFVHVHTGLKVGGFCLTSLATGAFRETALRGFDLIKASSVVGVEP